MAKDGRPRARPRAHGMMPGNTPSIASYATTTRNNTNTERKNSNDTEVTSHDHGIRRSTGAVHGTVRMRVLRRSGLGLCGPGEERRGQGRDHVPDLESEGGLRGLFQRRDRRVREGEPRYHGQVDRPARRQLRRQAVGRRLGRHAAGRHQLRPEHQLPAGQERLPDGYEQGGLRREGHLSGQGLGRGHLEVHRRRHLRAAVVSDDRAVALQHRAVREGRP